MLEKIVKSPYLNLLVGLVLLITAGYEIYESFEHGSVGAHHGIAFYALIHILRTLPEFMRGLEKIHQVSE